MMKRKKLKRVNQKRGKEGRKSLVIGYELRHIIIVMGREDINFEALVEQLNRENSNILHGFLTLVRWMG